MRKLVFAGLAIGGMALTCITPARAEPDYPVCITGGPESGYAGRSCIFMNYQQCQATARGIAAYCYDNPYLVGRSPVGRSYDQAPPPRRHYRTY